MRTAILRGRGARPTVIQRWHQHSVAATLSSMAEASHGLEIQMAPYSSMIMVISFIMVGILKPLDRMLYSNVASAVAASLEHLVRTHVLTSQV